MGHRIQMVVENIYNLVTIEKKLFLEVEVNYFDYAKTTQSGGVTISKLRVTPAPLRKNVQRPATLERHSFIPYNYIVNVIQLIIKFTVIK